MKTQNSQSLRDFFHKKTKAEFDDAVPFHLIQTSDYLPLLQELIDQSKKNIQTIKNNSAAPNFENVIVALDTCSEDLEQLSLIFSNLESAHGGDEYSKIAKEFYPLMSNFSSDVNLDLELFQKVKTVYDNHQKLNLSAEQFSLLDKYYKGFIRNGALLNDTDKNILREIDQKLAVIFPAYSENVLKATNHFEMYLETTEELRGLPETSLSQAKAAAEEKGATGKYLFTLQGPSYIPFMKYSGQRALRERMWRAYNARSFHDAFDNEKNVLEILQLRQQRAKLLGFKDHPTFVLSERMAENPETVLRFLERLLSPSKKAALKDLEEMQSFAKKKDGITDFKPWDAAYYSELLKEENFQFNEEELRPYFKLENVLDGVFACAEKLYGLKFKLNSEIPVYHEEVRAYEVYDKQNQFVSLFYTDFFPRPTKRPGAWMTLYREQGLFHGKIRRPHVVNVCNLTKSTPEKPSLLTYDEVRTVFHEFGHALHGMLSECTYRGVAGTNVFWDFVELPSQIMENWAAEKEGLDVFAKHYVTESLLPPEMIEKIKKVNQFQAGTMSLRQLQFGLLDMRVHITDPQTIKDLESFEETALSDARIVAREKGTSILAAFSHIFAGGYSAGYYSYKWAEVLDADAFEYFQEKGIFNADVAAKFKENILSKGGSEHPMTLYKKFRGREPDPDSLLRRDGLL